MIYVQFSCNLFIFHGNGCEREEIPSYQKYRKTWYQKLVLRWIILMARHHFFHSQRVQTNYWITPMGLGSRKKGFEFLANVWLGLKYEQCNTHAYGIHECFLDQEPLLLLTVYFSFGMHPAEAECCSAFSPLIPTSPHIYRGEH